MRRKGLAIMAVQTSQPRHHHRRRPRPRRRAVLSRVRQRFPLGPVFACEECFGPLEVAYDFPAGDPEALRAADRGRAGQHLAVRAAAARPRRRGRQAEPEPRLHQARPGRQPGPRAGRHRRAATSRTTPGTRPTPSRTGSSPSPSRPPARSASPRSPAPPRATSPAPSAPRPPAPASAPACSSRTTWSRARSSWPRVYGGELVGIEGNYDDVNRFCSELIGDPIGEGWGFVNVNLRPYYAEGSKTLAYEICEQLGWRCPTASSSRSPPARSSRRSTRASRSSSSSAWSRTSRTRSSAPRPRAAPRCPRAYKDGHDVVRPQRPEHHRQVAGHRQPGGRPVRPGHRAPYRRRGRGRERRAGRRRDQAAGADRGDLRGDRGRRDRRRDEEADRERQAGPDARRPSCSTPATA